MASCTHCGSTVGPESKVQPQNVDGATWCPACFVTRRMREEPDRFNASQACAARCQICGWTMVSFGALPGHSLRCGHCGRNAAIRLKLNQIPMTKREIEAIEDAARESLTKNPRRVARGV